jgi:hypothetical protein
MRRYETKCAGPMTQVLRFVNRDRGAASSRRLELDFLAIASVFARMSDRDSGDIGYGTRSTRDRNFVCPKETEPC